MKTINLIKIAAVILLGIALTGKVQADNDKYSRSAHPALNEITNSIKNFSIGFHSFERFFVQPLEEWMFETDYLSDEPTETIEPWMLEMDYLDDEVQSLESWMFGVSYLSDPAVESSLEAWMFDAIYLSR